MTTHIPDRLYTEEFPKEMASVKRMIQSAVNHAKQGDRAKAQDWHQRAIRRLEWLDEHFA